VSEDVDLARDRRIAAGLPGTWAAFFGRHGRLRPIQREAIPSILEGRNTLVVAPTASGKTEAAAAPVAERLLRKPGPSRALYVVPTRALANDLYQRLAPMLLASGLTVGLRTGDHPGTMMERVVLTTPESFDSVLCRGAKDGRHILEDLTAVVMDEIHLLASTARGEQLRWLLARLERILTEATSRGYRQSPVLQRIALSATIADLNDVAAAFLGAHHVIAQVGGARTIETMPDSLSGLTETVLPQHLAAHGDEKKFLVFCNSRRRVDQLTLALRGALAGSRFEVHAHHGSLSQSLREDAEKAFREKPQVVVVASSTLEIGIDVGDVDLVVLDTPPPDIASLLQRIGRGSRRRGTTRVLTCSADARHALIHRALLKAAADCALGPGATRPRLAVIRQQVLSYIFQSPQKRRRAETLELLAEGSGLCSSAEMRALIDHMLSGGDLSGEVEYVRLGPNWADRTASLHSVIEDAGGMQVVDDRTGTSLAHGVRYTGGDRLTPGGRNLDVRAVTANTIRTRPGQDAAPEADWSYAARSIVLGPSQGFALRRFLGIAPDDWPLLDTGDGVAIFHFGGAPMQLLVDVIAAVSGLTASASSPFALTLAKSDISTFEKGLSQSSESEVLAALSPQLDQAERRLGLPFANRGMPADLRLAEVASTAGLPPAIDRLRRIRLVAAGGAHAALRTLT
jgi:ATP-dependent Lhr-like helicase